MTLYFEVDLGTLLVYILARLNLQITRLRCVFSMKKVCYFPADPGAAESPEPPLDLALEHFLTEDRLMDGWMNEWIDYLLKPTVHSTMD